MTKKPPLEASIFLNPYQRHLSSILDVKDGLAILELFIGVCGALLFLQLLVWTALGDQRIRLFRSLLPSWRFFDRLTVVPKLLYREGRSESELGDWKLFAVSQERPIYTIFMNPSTTRDHAIQSNLLELSREIDESKDVSQTVPYKLVQNFLETELSLSTYQFKIEAYDENRNSHQDVLISPTYTRDENDF